MLLSEEHRVAFIQYLEQSVVTGEAIIRQMEGMKLPPAVFVREKNELVAAQIILCRLRTTEVQSVTA